MDIESCLFSRTNDFAIWFLHIQDWYTNSWVTEHVVHTFVTFSFLNPWGIENLVCQDSRHATNSRTRTPRPNQHLDLPRWLLAKRLDLSNLELICLWYFSTTHIPATMPHFISLVPCGWSHAWITGRRSWNFRFPSGISSRSWITYQTTRSCNNFFLTPAVTEDI